MKKISIYLCGTVKKHKQDEDDSWRNSFVEILKEKLKEIDVRFLDPTNLGHIKDSYSIFARDIFFASHCDFVIVNAESKLGIGAGTEMLVAKMHGIPVISVVPRNSYHRIPGEHFVNRLTQKEREKWVHPFVLGLSDVVVEDLDDAAKWVLEHLNKRKKAKNVINQAIKYYKKTHYKNDSHVKDSGL